MSSSEDLALLNDVAAHGADLQELQRLALEKRVGDLYTKLQELGYAKVGKRLKIERALLDTPTADLLICDGNAPPEQIAASDEHAYHVAPGPARPAGMSPEASDDDQEEQTAGDGAADNAEPDESEDSESSSSEDEPEGPIDWSKSDFYLEAEALSISSRRTMPPPPPPVPQWWIISSERLAIRERPSRKSKALDVLRKGAVLNVSNTPPTHETIGTGTWLKLASSELPFLCSLGSAKEAFVLVDDDKLGTLLTHVPISAVERLEKQGEPLFDEKVHPSARAAASQSRVAELLKLIQEEEEQRQAEQAKYEKRQREAAKRQAEYEKAAGPPRPPSDGAQPAVESQPLDAAVMNGLRPADPGDIGYAPGENDGEEAEGQEGTDEPAKTASVVTYQAAAGPARPRWVPPVKSAEVESASDSDDD